MLKTIKFILFISVIVLPGVLLGQNFYRIKAAISVKQVEADNKSNLTLGDVYYDMNFKKIVYNIKFPEKEIWVMRDSSFYKIVDSKVISKTKIPLVNESTIFHLALINRIIDYGLTNSFYSVKKVEKDQGLIISTWEADARYAKYFGKVIMSHKDRKLYGIVFYNPQGRLSGKQFFKNYILASGCLFPTEIVQITYNTKNEENYQVTAFKNVVVNGAGENNWYNYIVPK